MKRICITVLIFCLGINAFCQSVHERIEAAIGDGRWSDLRRIYAAEGDELQTDFMHPLSRFFISHFYNSPDSALVYASELLDKYRSEIAESLSAVIYFMADDLGKLNRYEDAANLLASLNKSTVDAGQNPDPMYTGFENQYRAIAKAGGQSMSRPDTDVVVPMKFATNDNQEPLMLFVPANLNGKLIPVTFDTGAGVNVMTKRMAEQVGARYIEGAGLVLDGIAGKERGEFALVDSLALGAIVYRNVPFQVIDLSGGDEDVARKLEEIGMTCIVGSSLMMQLGEICIDYSDMMLRIPAGESLSPDFAPNMYRSSENQLILAIKDMASGKSIDADFDTGASYTSLTKRYHERFEEHFTGSPMLTDTLRVGGVGGGVTHQTVKYGWSYSLGDSAEQTLNVDVITSGSPDADSYDVLWGLDCQTKFKRLVVNFTNMWVKAE